MCRLSESKSIPWGFLERHIRLSRFGCSGLRLPAAVVPTVVVVILAVALVVLELLPLYCININTSGFGFRFGTTVLEVSS
jgi:hypothetical protein